MAGTLLDVAGKRVLITGGLSGLGRAVAESFESQGARVVVIDNAIAAQSTALPGVEVIYGDVSDPSIVDAVRTGIDTLGGLDVLFANAGISGGSSDGKGDVGSADDIDWDVWNRVHAVNLDGVLRTVSAAIPTLEEQGFGRIVLTTSIAGLRGNGQIALSYQSSKAAVAALVRGLALQLAPHGVNVNGIAPGPFATGIGGGWLRTLEGERSAARVVPLGRVADPTEIVGTVQLLSSEASSYITGAVIPVDGGATAGVV